MHTRETQQKIDTVQNYILDKTGKSIEINLYKKVRKGNSLGELTMSIVLKAIQLNKLDKAYQVAKQYYETKKGI